MAYTGLRVEVLNDRGDMARKMGIQRRPSLTEGGDNPWVVRSIGRGRLIGMIVITPGL